MAKRILVLGGDGMLGHQLVQGLSQTFDVVRTLRGSSALPHVAALFPAERTLLNCDMSDPALPQRLVDQVQPDIVINAVGIVKQRDTSGDVLQSIEINAALPHRLAQACAKTHARLIHVSTDCVFDGTRGGYTEDDPADAQDVYGRSKHLGEVSGQGCLTLRTSIIGLELHRKRSLIEWFLAQTGQVDGYTQAIFSGLTTVALTRMIERLLVDHPDLSGVYHVASAPITKHDLLTGLAKRLDLPVRIVPSQEVVVDRSLDGSRITAQTGLHAPSWDDMLDGLAAEIRAR